MFKASVRNAAISSGKITISFGKYLPEDLIDHHLRPGSSRGSFVALNLSISKNTINNIVDVEKGIRAINHFCTSCTKSGNEGSNMVVIFATNQPETTKTEITPAKALQPS